MRIATWTRVFTLPALACGLLGLSVDPAHAATLTVNGWTLGEQVYVQSDTRTGWVNTAELSVTSAGQTGFSYCVDLAQGIGSGVSSEWSFVDAELSAGVLRAAWLVEYARPQFDLLVAPGSDAAAWGATKATAIAALQVSIWEVLSDAPGAYNLYSGEFSLRSGGASAGVMNLARDFLGALGSADLDAFQTSAVWAQNASRQDQIVFNPIPEPSSFVLFFVGAGVVAFAGTRMRA